MKDESRHSAPEITPPTLFSPVPHILHRALKGEKKAILKPDYRITGVACGFYAVYTTMCVMEYATEY